jgi:hypothetical protein
VHEGPLEPGAQELEAGEVGVQDGPPWPGAQELDAGDVGVHDGPADPGAQELEAGTIGDELDSGPLGVLDVHGVLEELLPPVAPQETPGKVIVLGWQGAVTVVSPPDNVEVRVM